MENIHPIEGLMKASMASIEKMVDVNTIIGDPIETSNNIVIIPISKVCFGFAVGGSEFNKEAIEEYKKKDKENEEIKYKLPFGGGTGTGVSINPVAFLIVQETNIKLLPINHSSTIDKLLDYIPDLFEKIEKKMNKNEEKTEKDTINEIFKNKQKEEPKKKGKQKIEKEEEYEVEYLEDEDLDD